MAKLLERIFSQKGGTSGHTGGLSPKISVWNFIFVVIVS